MSLDTLPPIDEEACRRFEQAWRAGDPPAIETCLPRTEDPLFLATLEELVVIDMDFRSRGDDPGEAIRVEAYLCRFPALNDAVVVRRLLREEARIRRRNGETPAREEYAARFPGLTLRDSGLDQTLPRGQAGSALAVPGYEVLGELGRGGMGVVYKARHLALGRLVALKMIRGDGSLLPDVLARFKSEAEAVARLQHPNIVQIHEVGEREGVPWFALEYVDGGNLAQALDHRPQPPLLSAALVETVARAVHHAHLQGIVHRDLKPANILLQNPKPHSPNPKSEIRNPNEEQVVSDFGFRISDLTPKVTDFGLAKRLDERQRQTRTGDILGTPWYMAPEQADDKMGPVSPATDVYALGGILYEMLTGRPPFQAETLLDILLQVRTADPVRPGRLVPRCPRDLETICLKCLHKQPARRYPSALELAEDLRRFQVGEPIRARPVSVGERGVKWAKRHPAATGLIVVSLIATVTLGAWGAIYNAEREQSLQESIAEQARTKEQRDRAERNLYLHSINLADREWWGNNATAADAVLDKADPELRDWEWYHLRWRNRHHRFVIPDAFAVALGPHDRVATAEKDGIRLRDAGDRRLLRTLGRLELSDRLVFSPDGQFLAAGREQTFSADGNAVPNAVKVWNADSGVELHTLPFNGGVRGLAFSPDGSRLAVAGRLLEGGGLVLVHNMKTGKVILTLPLEYHPQGVSYSHDGKRLAVPANQRHGIGPGIVQVWDAQAGKPLYTLKGSRLYVNTAVFSPREDLLASDGGDHCVKLWEGSTGRPLRTLGWLAQPVHALAFSADGLSIASGSGDQFGRAPGEVRLWETATGKGDRLLRGCPQLVTQLAFAPDGRTLAATSTHILTSEVRGWDLVHGQELVLLPESAGGMNRASFAPSGALLVRGDWGRTVRSWDVSRRRPIRTFSATELGVRTLEVSRDGRHVFAMNAGEKTVQLWDATTGERGLTLRGFTRPVSALAFSSGGDQIAAVEEGGTLHLFEGNTGKVVRTFRVADVSPEGLVFSPDGNRLLLADGRPSSRTPHVWVHDVRTGEEPTTFRKHTGAINRVVVHPRGDLAASAAGSGEVWLWKLDTGEAVRKFQSSPEPLYAVAFSPDGRRLVSTGLAGTVDVWDVETGERLLVLRGPPGYLFDITFSPDGQSLAAVGDGTSIRVWPAPRAEPKSPR